MNSDGSLQVGTVDDVFWVRVRGRGTFQNSVLLKECFERVFQRGQKNLVVDLERCASMDSTFMGILASAAIRMGDEGKVHVINANLRNCQLLTSLGLHYLVEIDQDGSLFKEQRVKAAQGLKTAGEPSSVDQKAQAQIVLEAHESLMEANEENVARFQDVVEFLRNEVADDRKRS